MKKCQRFARVMACAAVILVLPWSALTAATVSSTEGAKILSAIERAGISGVKLDLNVRVPVPGAAGHPPVDLWATVISAASGEQRPTILVATPYRREIIMMLYLPLVARGYNLMALDLRGTGSAEGVWTSFDPVEHYDVKYVVDSWIPSRAWSDGDVGMIGPSYMGIIQYLAAGLIDRDENGEPLHLKAIFPMVPMSDAYRDIVMHGGNVDLEFIPMWLGGVDILGALPSLLILGENEFNTSQEDIQEAVDVWKAHIDNIPVTLGWIMDYGHSFDSVFYDQKSPMIYWPIKPAGGWELPEGDNVIPSRLPVFTVGGWFDIFTRGTLNNYQYGLSRHSTSDKAMIVGEWYHLDGSLGLGLNSLMMGDLPARWFDWKIKGNGDCFMKEFPVMLYVMGENRWRVEKSWPLPASRTEKRTLYLSKSRPGEIDGDWYTDNWLNLYDSKIFSLRESASACAAGGSTPVVNHAADLLNIHGTFSRSSVRWLMGLMALPAQAVKALSGRDVSAGMFYEDERYDERKVVTFTTEELDEDVEIVGPVLVSFWAKTRFTQQLTQLLITQMVNAIKDGGNIDTNLILDLMNRRDVQWTVELNDVYPDGRARNISSGWLSAWHRQYNPNEPAGLTEHALDPDYVPFDPFYDGPDREPKEIIENHLYQYAVELWPTCNVFKKGHRIRISISASDFPHLLPILRPSSSTIVIDAAHQAKLDYTVTRPGGQGVTWKWIDNADNYLLTHVDPADPEDAADGGTVLSGGVEGDSTAGDDSDEGGSSFGCGSLAMAHTGAGGASAVSGMMGALGLMLLPLGVIMGVRRWRRGRR